MRVTLKTQIKNKCFNGMRCFICLITLLINFQLAYSQGNGKKISGVVSDEYGDPVPGATDRKSVV